MRIAWKDHRTWKLDFRVEDYLLLDQGKINSLFLGSMLSAYSRLESENLMQGHLYTGPVFLAIESNYNEDLVDGDNSEQDESFSRTDLYVNWRNSEYITRQIITLLFGGFSTSLQHAFSDLTINHTWFGLWREFSLSSAQSL